MDLDSFNKRKKKIRYLLPAKGINATLEALRNIVLEDRKIFQILILIESQHREIRRNDQEGIISYEMVQLEENKIRKKLLEFIEGIEIKDTIYSLYQNKSRELLIELHSKVLKNKNVNLIFSFGDCGSGKATFIISMITYIEENFFSKRNPNNLTDNKYLSWEQNRLNDGQFPGVGTANQQFEYDIAVQVAKFSLVQNLSFIHLNGEPMKKISAIYGGVMPEGVEVYLKGHYLPLLIFITIQYGDLIKESKGGLITDFLKYLVANDIQFIGIGIIIIGFDRENGKKRSFDNILLWQSPLIKYLKQITNSYKIFPFSVGKVSFEKHRSPKIENLDLSDCKEIFEWIWNCFSENNNENVNNLGKVDWYKY